MAELVGGEFGIITGRVLKGAAMDACNTFAAPDAVKSEAFTDFQREGNSLRIDLPAKSVSVLEIVGS